jgi:hypothetical protein
VIVVKRGRRISTRQGAEVLAGPVAEQARRGLPAVVQDLRVAAEVVAGGVIDLYDFSYLFFYFNFAGSEYNTYFRQNHF